MALENGLILIMLYVAIFIVASYISYKKQTNKNRIFYIALFLIGIYIVNKTFILPIPLNESGMLLIGGDNSIELKDMFILVPFRTLIDYYQYINIGEYFLSLSDFFAGSFLIGFSVVRIFDGKTHIQRITVIVSLSFAIPIFSYILYIIVKLLTGYVWKYVDLTTLCVFVLGYWIGGLISLLVRSLLQNTNKKTEKNKEM